jgi:hypothetical protein
MPIGLWSGLFDGCDIESDLGDPILAYGGSRVASCDLGLWLDDKLVSMIEGQATPPVDIGGFEYLFTEHSGKKFYNANNSLMTTGHVIVKNATFDKIGLVCWPGFNWGSTLGASGLSFPAGGVANPLTELDNLSMINCGLSAFFGSTLAILGVSNHGTTKIHNCDMSMTIGSKDAFNFLGAVWLENGATGAGSGGESTAYGFGAGTLADGPDPINNVLQITQNTFDLDPPEAGDKSPFAVIFVNGLAKPNGDPRGHWQDAVISNNILGGKVDNPVLVVNQLNGQVNYNDIEGKAAKNSIKFQNSNWVQKNNTFLTPQQFNVVIDGMSAESINQLGTGGTVLDTTGSSKVTGMQSSTDSTLLTEDDIATRRKGRNKR